MKILFALIFILTISQKNCNGEQINYKPQKLETDINIEEQKIELMEKVIIQETDNLILTHIQDVDFSPDGKRLVICDPTSGTLLYINYKTGQILKHLKTDLSLTDSLIISGRKPLKFLNKQHEYLHRKEYFSRKITHDEVNWIKNKFFKPIYIDDNCIYLLSAIYAFAKSYDSTNICDSRSALIAVDTNMFIKSCKIVENNESICPLPLDFIYKRRNNEMLIPCTNGLRQNEMKFDSLPSVSKYDLKGNLIGIVSYLPENYEKYFIGYDFQFVPLLANFEDNIIISYPVDLSLYGENNKRYFSLYNLPYSNDSGFTIFGSLRKDFVEECRKNPIFSKNDSGEVYKMKFMDYYKKKQNKSLNKKSLERLFPVRIVNLYTINDKIVFWLNIFEASSDNYYFLLQEYRIDGRLLSQTIIPDDDINKLKYLSFDKNNNYLVLFKKGPEGWIIEKRRWE